LFGSDVTIVCPFTSLYEKFREDVSKATPEGRTSLYDSLSKSCDELVKIKSKYPDIKLRIFALSDGDDTASETNAYKVAEKIFNNNIVVDSICIGNETNDILKSIWFKAIAART
jgi:Mg-chelatase subunit ChlD